MYSRESPVAVAITWMNDPFPGWMPYRVGSVRSALDATNRAPAATARPPCSSSE